MQKVHIIIIVIVSSLETLERACCLVIDKGHRDNRNGMIGTGLLLLGIWENLMIRP